MTESPGDDDIRRALREVPWSQAPSAAAHEIRRVGTARRRRAQVARSLAAAGIVMLIGLVVPWSSVENKVGFGAGENDPVVRYHTTPSQFLGAVSGDLTLQNGCLYIGPTLALWPSSAKWDSSRQAVLYEQSGVFTELPVGKLLPDGLLGGGLTRLENMRSWLDDASMARAKSCLGSETVVLVVN